MNASEAHAQRANPTQEVKAQPEVVSNRVHQNIRVRENMKRSL